LLRLAFVLGAIRRGMGSGFEGLDFSHEGVKRVIGLFTGFVSVIASTPHCFLYLNQRIHDDKKKRKRKIT